MRSATRILAMVIVAIIVLLLSVTVAEVGLRLLPARGEGFKDTSLPRVRTARWNQADFRTRSYETAKPEGVFRLFVLGDSYTWGSGLHPEDAYPDRLERRLAELDAEVDFQVVNFSRPGWSTERQWQSVRHQLADWAPDLIVLGFVFNDPEVGRMSEELQRSLTAQRPAGGLSGWLYGHSRAFAGVYDVFENRRVRERLVAYYHGLFEDPKGWRKCRRALSKLRDAARELDVPFLVAVFPIFDSQIDESYRYHDLHELLAETTAELEIESVDLRAPYVGVDANRLALTPFTDPHPSELAQRIAADALLAELLRRGWLPVSRQER